jgi:hypothetical protein
MSYLCLVSFLKIRAVADPWIVSYHLQPAQLPLSLVTTMNVFVPQKDYGSSEEKVKISGVEVVTVILTHTSLFHSMN